MFTFLSRKKRYTVFLVGESSIQVAKLSSRGDAFVRFFEAPVNPGIIAGGEIKQPEALVQILKSIALQAKITDRYVVVGIPETKATTHTLTLPNLQDTEIEQAIKREAPSFLPFTVEEEYIDWKLVSKTKEESKILISAVPKKVIEGFAGCFQEAGLHPVTFETTSLSLFRLVPQEARTLVFATEVGESATVFILGIDGSIEVCSVITDNANVVDKMKRVAQFFIEQKIEGTAPDTLYICGKQAASVAGPLSTALSMKIQALKAKLPKFPEAKQVEYAVLYSLACKPVAPPADRKTINVMPLGLVEEYEIAAQKKGDHLLTILCIFLAMLLVGVTFYTYFTVSNATKALVRRAVPAAKAGSPGTLSYSSAKLKLLERLATENDATLKLMKVVEDAKPIGVVISGISCEQEKKECIIAGTADSRDLLISYKDALIASKAFQQVEIPYSSLEKDVDVDYRIIVK